MSRVRSTPLGGLPDEVSTVGVFHDAGLPLGVDSFVK